VTTPDINLSGFQPCDVRGRHGPGPDAQISPLHAFLIGQALAELLPAGAQTLTSGDGRASTPGLLAALDAGLGGRAVSLGAGVPTPLAYLARQELGLGGCAIVTASHNPPAFNGIKLQLGDQPPTPELLAVVRNRVQARAEAAAGALPASPARAAEGTEPPALRRAWAAYDQCLADVFGKRLGGLRIALDCMHGCWAGDGPARLRAAGAEVVALRDRRLGDFAGATPDPAVDAHLTDLGGAVRGGGFALGAALDGDGDRVRFLDETGHLLDNGSVLVLLARHLQACGPESRRAGAVVYDQKTRLAVVAELRQAGLQPVRERSGHSFMRARLLAEHAILGGENSGHFFWGTPGFYPVVAGDCGLFAVFVVADLLRRAGRSLSELAATVPPSPFYTGDIRGLRYEGDRAALLAAVAASARDAGYVVDTEDGVRLESPTAFVHLRASVTEAGLLTAALDALDADGLVAMADPLAALLPAAAQPIAAAVRQRVRALVS